MRSRPLLVGRHPEATIWLLAGEECNDLRTPKRQVVIDDLVKEIPPRKEAHGGIIGTDQPVDDIAVNTASVGHETAE